MQRYFLSRSRALEQRLRTCTIDESEQRERRRRRPTSESKPPLGPLLYMTIVGRVTVRVLIYIDDIVVIIVV